MCYIYKIQKSLFCIFLILSLNSINGQSISNSPIRLAITQLDSFYNNTFQEIAFLHLDKPYYTAGDTILFKAYLLDKQSNTPAKQSGLLYIDLYEDSSNIIKQFTVPVAQGVSWGEISIPITTKSGTYQIRAYTNWMRNYTEDYFFHNSLYIANPSTKNILVTLNKKDSANQLNLLMELSSLNQVKIINKSFRVKLLDQNKVLLTKEVMTDKTGKIDLTISFPEKINSRQFILFGEDINDQSSFVIPILPQNQSEIDLQFLPESGYLIDGIPSRIGFKAIRENGRYIDVKGKILNSNQEIVAEFTSLHKGMGVFSFIPKATEKYAVELEYPYNKSLKNFKFPFIRNSGIVMSVDKNYDKDSIELTFNSSKDLITRNDQFILIAESRNVVCYGRNLTINNNTIKFTIPTDLFPTGVTRFYLLSKDYATICERSIFINQFDTLDLKITTDSSYSTNSHISLELIASNSNKIPIAGNFSIAITDDTQVQTDAYQKNILTEILLNSNIKGYIEDPGYYLSNDQIQTQTALDCLLLTQGWTNVNPETILTGKFKSLYNPEKTYTLKGKVTNAFNKPIINSKVALLSTGKYQIVKDTITNENGGFVFDQFPGFDSTVFVLQAKNTKGRTFNVGIGITEFKPATFKKNSFKNEIPWYLNDLSVPNSDYLQKTISNQIVSNDFRYQKDSEFLPDVIVSSKRIVRGSQNLNGPGEADLIIGMQELEKMGKKPLLQVLKESIPGFREDINMRYRINRSSILFVVDGQPLIRLFPGREYTASVKNFLEYCLAENVRGIELMTSMRFTTNYSLATGGVPSATSEVAFIEITTHRGAGPFFKEAPGFYIHKPLPYYWPKEYYRPRFMVTENSFNIDRYSTIYWNPNLMTGENGRAKFDFFTGSRQGSYTIVAQGTDFNGGLGIVIKKIFIK